MSLAVYVHIPYCLQRCRYCDFTTFEFTEIQPPAEYVEHVLHEIRGRRALWGHSSIQTLYFGGGTPSLISPDLIVSIKRELANVGFAFDRNAEITLEINPATIDESRLNLYLEAGFNRFSVGAQTFNDNLLRACGRRHSAADTHSTLRLLRRYGLNYSFDLLFALPGQTRSDLARDLETVTEYSPPHLSAYCLTVPANHPMSLGRPPENEQVGMFSLIESALGEVGLNKYEISNFSKPGSESRHNLAYWNDVSYWGLGLSSHSYDRNRGPFGTRFWNPKSLIQYQQQSQRCGVTLPQFLEEDQYETLLLHEAMTDFCHMHLRTSRGLSEDAMRNRFGQRLSELIHKRLTSLATKSWLCFEDGHWRLTRDGALLSNKVFEELCFLPNEVGPETLTPQSADTYCSV